MPQTQRNPVDSRPAPKVKTIDLDLQPLLRQSIADAGWKQDALAAYLHVDASYLSRQLSGEKPLTLDQIERYPSEIIAAFSARLNRDVLGCADTLLDAAETFSQAAKDAVRVLRLLSPDLGHRRMATAQIKEEDR